MLKQNKEAVFVLLHPTSIMPLLAANPWAQYSQESWDPPINMGPFALQFSRSGFEEIAASPVADWRWFSLGLEADTLALRSGTTGLLCLPHLKTLWKQVGVVPYRHQIHAAERVVQTMRGQAILADEVGLGKTIEAGLVLKEYILRGLVRRALILTPASLCWQWYCELQQKFQIYAALQRSHYDWEHAPILIASIDTAKRKPHCDIVHSIAYDMVIVDEAHKLKNNRSASWQLLHGMQKTFFLMLTATPVQNDLKELYNLITLLQPGKLGTYKQFRRKFVKDKRTPKNPEHLRAMLSKVMIRNRRGEETVVFPARKVYPILVTLSTPEQEAYERLSAYIRSCHRGQNILSLITLQREACSSLYTAGLTLQRLHQTAEPWARDEIESLVDQLLAIEEHSKCRRLLELVQTIDDKIIIFTEYRATQQYIRYRLERAGYPTLGFDGSLSRSRKQWIQHLFQQENKILVSTETGGEGFNFQFCNQLINYDLPWNPMRLEQRIGRLHRLGQKRPVHIHNLVTKDTIEEHIMYLLHSKINMFQMVMGELDAILINLKLDSSFEGKIMDIFLQHGSNYAAIKVEMEHLGDVINAARETLPNKELLP